VIDGVEDVLVRDAMAQRRADALDWCGASRADPPALEGLRERFLPERTLRGRQNTKLRYAVLAAAALQGGTEPDPLDEVARWQADDFWQYALFAAVAYIAPPPAGRACRYARQARTCSAPWPPSAIMTTLGRSRRRSPGPEVRAGRPSTPARAVVLGMGAQLVAGRQVQPGEHHDLVARSQVHGTLRDLLIEADPRPGRAVALVRRLVEDSQGRLHPPDRHQAVAHLHEDSLLAGRGHGTRGCPACSRARVVTVKRATRKPHLSAVV